MIRGALALALYTVAVGSSVAGSQQDRREFEAKDACSARLMEFLKNPASLETVRWEGNNDGADGRYGFIYTYSYIDMYGDRRETFCLCRVELYESGIAVDLYGRLLPEQPVKRRYEADLARIKARADELGQPVRPRGPPAAP